MHALLMEGPMVATGGHFDRSIDFSKYRDEGCEFSPTCLHCHLPLCKYDDASVKEAQRMNRLEDVRLRNEAMLVVKEEEGLTIGQVAARFGLSKRSVFRALSKTGVAIEA
jgi:hypothetical protein